MQGLSELEASREGLRDQWASWNPQREAARQLEDLIATGKITLQVRNSGMNT